MLTDKDVETAVQIIRETNMDPLTDESLNQMLGLAIRSGYTLGKLEKPKASMSFRKKQ